MKAFVFVLTVLFSMCVMPLFGHGVLLNDDDYTVDIYRLISSEISVDVEDQVAIITSSQFFMNQYDENTPKFAFPIPEGASATQLRWWMNEKWYIASLTDIAQDPNPPTPSDNWPTFLNEYLGDTPLIFNFDNPVDAEMEILVELTYVMLLPYFKGDVSFQYQNRYEMIQDMPLESVALDFSLTSQRTIMELEMPGFLPLITNDGYNAHLELSLTNEADLDDFVVTYTLDPEQFGLYGMSTKLDEVPDELPEGFCLFIAEPDPNNSQIVIDKTFTLIIDVSGSMLGTKLDQAKAAANYIVDNLNPGDSFNIVKFESVAHSLWRQHNYVNPTRITQAHNYINNLQAHGGTNISAALDLAVPQYSVTDPDNANIIIFFTDGDANMGVTSTPALVAYAADLFDQVGVTINLFTLGIGDSVNEQLLTQLAINNNGTAAFVIDNELQEAITNLYDMISNPVLLSPTVTFGREAQAEAIYPNPLPNVYQGYQMLVSGRYVNGGETSINLDGYAYGENVHYQYNLDLAHEPVLEKQFITKIWAKLKIENLLALYYSYLPDSAEAQALKDQIIEVSLDYGVMSPFTAFSGTDPDDPPIDNEDDTLGPSLNKDYVLKGNFPNPFNPETTIQFTVNNDLHALVKVKIYNLRGQVVRTLALHTNGKGDYEVLWDGNDNLGRLQPSAIYFYVIDFGHAQLSGKMIMSK